MAWLEIEHVSKHFGGVYALRDVSLRCKSGDIIGLIGPNGAGKTTLLNVISAALPVDEGAVKLDGKRLDGNGPRNCALMGIGRTFQNIRLFGRLTVRQNIDVAYSTALAHRKARLNDVTVDGLLEFMNLSGAQHRRACELPYGQQRRLEIARALALAPDFLLLDEPAAGMNEIESERLISSIRAVRDRSGCGIIVIDHDLRFIMTVCESIHVMHMGELIAHGPPEAIQKNPRVIEVYIGGRGRAQKRARKESGGAENLATH